MGYNFERFEKVGGKYESRLTLTRSFSIGLPTRFYNDNEIKNYKYAVLFWDAENKALAIHFTSSESESGRFKIVHNKNNLGGGITARSFFNHHKIDVNKFHNRYEWEKIKQEGVGDLFIIKLKERVGN